MTASPAADEQIKQGTTRERLLETVWGYDYPGETRTVDVHVRRLRQKLGPPVDERVETVVGVGYRYRGGA